jgi:hypothetical protein
VRRYFERRWPNSELIEAFEFTRLIRSGDEVVVTYESTKTDGSRFRNTEVRTFDGERIYNAEVYFGWNLPQANVSKLSRVTSPLRGGRAAAARGRPTGSDVREKTLPNRRQLLRPAACAARGWRAARRAAH